MANHSDPVEAAKRGAKKTEASGVPDGIKEHVPEGQPIAPPQPPSASGHYVPPETAKTLPIPPQAPPATLIRIEPAAQPALICKRYRVKADWRGSLFGQMIHLRAGEILDKGHYGDDAFRRLFDGGLQLEALEEPTP